MPIFMVILMGSQSLMAGKNMEETRAKLKQDYFKLVQGAWMCWIPALVVNFRYVPLKYRLLYVNFVQVFFGVYLSKMVNNPTALQEASDDPHFASPHVPALAGVTGGDGL